jgi:RNA polymerase sigma-70 factor (ECF subfamily)
MMDQYTDEQLLLKIKADDKAAFQLLVSRYLNKIWRVAYNVLFDKQDAEDVTQEVFITVWNKRHEWAEGDAAFSTWLYRVAINRAIDFKRRRRPDHVEIDEDLPATSDIPNDEVIMQSQFSAAFRQCVQALPEKQMACLMLFYYEELNVEEICVRLQASEDSVRSLLKRGRANLKGIMHAKFGDEFHAAMRAS